MRPDAAEELTDLTRQGVVREKAIELPPEAEAIRDEVRAFAQSIKDLPADEQRTRLIETGYVMPHWPKPYGRAAGAVEQLVIEQEFAAAGITRPGVRHHRRGTSSRSSSTRPRTRSTAGCARRSSRT